MEPKDKPALPPMAKYALYYRSEQSGNWYEEGCFIDEWQARDCMLEHIRVHSDMDCVIVKLTTVCEYRGWTDGK
tara:strand:- start:344 stop:565 length:222 start_codon:yes stop_codon:yes gene_type:complete